MSTTPLATATTALYNLFNGQYTGYTVYQYFPSMGVQPKAIVIQQVAGVMREAGGTSILPSKHGRYTTLHFQLDVYDVTDDLVKVTADLMLLRLITQRSSMKTVSGIDHVRVMGIRSMLPGTAGERMYRKVIDIEVFIKQYTT